MFDFILDFDRPFYSFNRSVKDMEPYKIKRYEDHAVIVHNIIGIKEEDLSIELKNARNITYLEITGETKDEVLGTLYTVNSRFSIDKDEVKNIEYTLRDGLVYVSVYYKKPEKVKIQITKKK